MLSNRMGASLEIKTNLPGGEHKVVHVPVDESQNRVHVHLSRIETMIKHVLVEAEILRKSDDHQQPPSEVVNCVVEPTAAEGGTVTAPVQARARTPYSELQANSCAASTS